MRSYRSAVHSAMLWLAASQAASAQSIEDFLPDFSTDNERSFERSAREFAFRDGRPEPSAPRMSIEIAGAQISPDFKRRGLRVDIPMDLAFGAPDPIRPPEEADAF